MESEVALQDFEAALPARKGRPKGAANRQVDEVESPATACTKCDSTRRSTYFNRRTLQVSGVCFLTKKPYTSIIIRRTKCLDCGQHRDDRTLVNEPPKK